MRVFAALPNKQKQTKRGSQKRTTTKKNRSQRKKQENSPEEELNEKEASNLLDIGFRVMIVKILNTMKKDIETIKKRTSQK